MPAYCEIALPVPLDRTFTYAIRDGQNPQRGARVIAPFRNEKLIGVVMGLSAKPPADSGPRIVAAKFHPLAANIFAAARQSPPNNL